MTIVGEAFIPVRALTDEWVAKVKGDTSKAAKEAEVDVGKIVTTASAAIAGIAIDAGRSYAAGTNKIIELTGASGEALDDLTDSMRDVGQNSDLESGLDTIGTVISRLNQRLDLTGPILEERTKQIVQLAEVTGGDASQSVTTIIDLFQKWNVPTERQGDLLDYLFAASQKAGVGIETLIGGAGVGKRALDALGFGLEDSIAFLAQIEAQGGNSEKVLIALGTGFARLASNTKNPEAALERVAGRIRDAKSDTEALQIAIDVFGTRAAPVLAGVFRGSAFDIDGFNADLGDTKGRIDDVRDATITWFDRLGIIRRQIGSFIGPVADELAVVSTIIAGIGPTASGISAVAGGFRNVRAEAQGLQSWLRAGGEEMSSMSATARVLRGNVSGLALAGGTAAAGLGILITFLETRSKAAIQEARTDVTSLVSTLDSAARAGPGAVRRLAEDLEAGLDFEGTGGLAMLNAVDQYNQELKQLEQRSRAATGEERKRLLLQVDLLEATKAYAEAVREGDTEGARAAQEDRSAAVAGLIGLTKDQARAERDGVGATQASGEAAEGAATSVRELARERRENAAAAREERDAQLAAVGDFLGVQSAVYAARDATREYRDARAEVDALEAKGKQGTEKYAEAVRELRDARLDAVGARLSEKQAVASYVDQIKSSSASEAEAIRRLERFGARAGLTKAEVDKLVESVKGHVRGLDELPDQKGTRIEAPGLAAVSRGVDQLDRNLDGLPDSVYVKFVAAGLDTIAAQIAALFADVGGSVAPGGPSGGGGGGGGSGGGGGRRPPAQANQRSVSHTSIHVNGRELASAIEVSEGENQILLGGRAVG